MNPLASYARSRRASRVALISGVGSVLLALAAPEVTTPLGERPVPVFFVWLLVPAAAIGPVSVGPCQAWERIYGRSLLGWDLVTMLGILTANAAVAGWAGPAGSLSFPLRLAAVAAVAAAALGGVALLGSSGWLTVVVAIAGGVVWSAQPVPAGLSWMTDHAWLVVLGSGAVLAIAFTGYGLRRRRGAIDTPV